MFEEMKKYSDVGLLDADRALIAIEAAKNSRNSAELYENARQMYDALFSKEGQTYCGVEIHQDIGALAMGYGLLSRKEEIPMRMAMANNANLATKISESEKMLGHCFALIPGAKKIYEILGKRGIEDWKRTYCLDDKSLSAF